MKKEFKIYQLWVRNVSVDCVKHIKMDEEKLRAKLAAIQPVFSLSSKFFQELERMEEYCYNFWQYNESDSDWHDLHVVPCLEQLSKRVKN